MRYVPNKISIHGLILVLGGEGWKLRNFYINELDKYLPHRPDVEILSLEKFIAEANRGRL